MGRWFQEEVAGDRYIFDSEKNPIVLGCPQGSPVFAIIGEQERAARRACDAHNAMVSERDRYRHRAMEAEYCVSALTAERDSEARFACQYKAERDRAIRALERAGFTDHGAQEWKPPLGWGDTGKQRERLIALEAERDELQRRLVRVKAESLRVVVAKETCSLNECSERFYIQPTCCHDRQVTGKNIQADFRRHPDTTVLPVRLEPWEDE